MSEFSFLVVTKVSTDNFPPKRTQNLNVGTQVLNINNASTQIVNQG